jgi:hypothetical protein
MAITITPVLAGTYAKTWNITSSADGDLTAQIPHGFTVQYVATAPALVLLTPLQHQAYTKQWTLGVVDATNINLGATSAAGGGLAGTPQLQVVALLPQSIMD